MKYVNPETNLEIDLTRLPERQKKFFEQALQKYRKNTSWLEFDTFIFGPASPLFVGRKSHLDVLKDPLYKALKDMSLQLGVQQGMIKRSSAQGRETDGQRGQESRSRTATDERHSEKGRDLAASS